MKYYHFCQGNVTLTTYQSIVKIFPSYTPCEEENFVSYDNKNESVNHSPDLSIPAVAQPMAFKNINEYYSLKAHYMGFSKAFHDEAKTMALSLSRSEIATQ